MYRSANPKEGHLRVELRDIGTNPERTKETGFRDQIELRIPFDKLHAGNYERYN